MARRLIGYVRVSRVAGREGDSFIAPGIQREKIEAAAAADGDTVVSWQEDLDQPGSRYERPGFQAALAAVEARAADGIIVYALDRFARSVPDAALALRRLEDADGVLVSVRDKLDTSTGVGKFARTMMLAIAELELDRIRENWKVAGAEAIRRGVHVGPTPVGYLLPRRGAPLELDPEAAPVVRELFLQRAAGTSWTELARLLDERLPREQGSWTRQTISSIIRCRTYRGEVRQGDLVNRDAHEPLITREEWQAAQSTERRLGRSRGGSLLAGRLRCAGCGQTLTRVSDGARGYSNYRCRVRHGGGLCPEPARISVRRADEYVEGELVAWLERDRVTVEASEATAALETARARVEAAEEELVEYRDAQLVSIIGPEGYREGLEKRAADVDEARQALEEARRAVESPLAGVHDLAEVWPTLELAEKRSILAAAIDAVVVKRAHSPGNGSPAAGRVQIFWRGEAPPGLLGGNGRLRPVAIRERAQELRVPRSHHG